MYSGYDPTEVPEKPDPGRLAAECRQQLQRFLQPLLDQLDAQIDARLVRTFLAVIQVLLTFRHRSQGLVLAELGSYLLPPSQAPAGTKRIANLVHCAKWEVGFLEEYCWNQALTRAALLVAAGEEAVAVWDESVVEKPESRKVEGLCPVRSAKGARLQYSGASRAGKGGYGRPQGRPLLVSGHHWLALLITGLYPSSGPPTLAATRWFTTRRKHPAKTQTHAASPTTPPAAAAPDPFAVVPSQEDRPTEPAVPHAHPEPQEPAEPGAPATRDACTDPDLAVGLAQLRRELFAEAVRRLGPSVPHVMDRGWASAAWLGELFTHAVPFVLRWPKRYRLCPRGGEARPAWQIARGRAAWDKKYLRFAGHADPQRVTVLAFAVTHPDYPAQALWLVVVRSGRGKKEPWYLLTNEPVLTPAAAWRCMWLYLRRWQIEETFRHEKAELALESPRVRAWKTRRKLLWLVTLAYAFLLHLLGPPFAALREQLLRQYCHRTGRWTREVRCPFYRVRMALSRLWLAYPGPYYRYGPARAPTGSPPTGSYPHSHGPINPCLIPH